VSNLVIKFNKFVTLPASYPSASRLFKRSVDRSVGRSVGRSISRFVRQLISTAIILSVKFGELILQCVSQWLSQLIENLYIQLVGQSVRELVSESVSNLVVGSEVFTTVVMKSIIFWDMTPCSPSSFNLRFGGTHPLHLHGRRNKFSKNQLASRWQAD
jgi:hypothetical protein